MRGGPKEYLRDLQDWLERLERAQVAMTPEQRADVEAWERNRSDSQPVATTGWPGWEALIGRKPRPEEYGPATHTVHAYVRRTGPDVPEGMQSMGVNVCLVCEPDKEVRRTFSVEQPCPQCDTPGTLEWRLVPASP